VINIWISYLHDGVCMVCVAIGCKLHCWSWATSVLHHKRGTYNWRV